MYTGEKIDCTSTQGRLKAYIVYKGKGTKRISYNNSNILSNNCARLKDKHCILVAFDGKKVRRREKRREQLQSQSREGHSCKS